MGHWPTTAGRTRSTRRARRSATISAPACNGSGATTRRWRGSTKALALRRGFTIAMNNKAPSLQQIRRLDEAAAIYHELKAIDPGNADADWNLSFLHLLTGDFEKGWAARELRWTAVLSGNAQQQNDHNRSVPLHKLSAILDANADF